MNSKIKCKECKRKAQEETRNMSIPMKGLYFMSNSVGFWQLMMIGFFFSGIFVGSVYYNNKVVDIAQKHIDLINEKYAALCPNINWNNMPIEVIENLNKLNISIYGGNFTGQKTFNNSIVSE